MTKSGYVWLAFGLLALVAGCADRDDGKSADGADGSATDAASGTGKNRKDAGSKTPTKGATDGGEIPNAG